jgi:hypothetical protein
MAEEGPGARGCSRALTRRYARTLEQWRKCDGGRCGEEKSIGQPYSLEKKKREVMSDLKRSS